MILFFDQESIWQCAQGLRCECRGEEVNYRDPQPAGALYRPNIRRKELSEPWLLWLDMIESYSLLSLTKCDDKLPALAGIATVFAEQFKCEYLAGMWRDHLKGSIAWKALPQNNDKNVRRQDHLKPSWSWISCNGGVDTFLCRDLFSHPRFYLQKASCTVRGQNPYGKVAEGLLQVRCAWYKPQSIVKAQNDWNTFRFSLVMPQLTKQPVDFVYFPDDTETALKHTEVMDESLAVIALGHDRYYGIHGRPENPPQVFLMLKASTTNLELYERVGLVEGWGQASEDFTLPWDVKVFNII
jgi:hypothetical protein